MRRANLVDINLELRPMAHQRSARAGVVQMDVGQQQRAWSAVAECIKNNPRLAGATIMMLTSADRTGDVSRCRELGVAAYRGPARYFARFNILRNGRSPNR